MKFTCPEHGSFDAKGERRQTTPAKVVPNPSKPDEAHHDGATDDEALSPTHDFDTGRPKPYVAIAESAPVTVTIGRCPECGTPVPKDE